MVTNQEIISKISSILDYWHYLEFFSPFFPPQSKNNLQITLKKIDTPKTKLPWLNSNPSSSSSNKSKVSSYNVYIGKIVTGDLIEEMLKNLGIDDVREKDRSLCCIGGVKVSKEGTLLENTFQIVPLVWAISEIVKEKRLDADLSIEKLHAFNQKINGLLVTFSNKIETEDFTSNKILIEDLEKILDLIVAELGIKTPVEPSIIISPVFSKKDDELVNTTAINEGKNYTQRDEETENINLDLENEKVDILTSFYINDIKMVKKQITEKDRVFQYISSLMDNNSAQQRIEIDKDIKQMKYWLHPSKYPLGKWPSGKSPSLMQQIAINIAISEEALPHKFFSINGPPGTGKTTLIKEIIADNIVKRALFLASNYHHPNDAFVEKKLLINPPDKYSVEWYTPDPRLTKFGLIVASNNNNAVENITTELPLTKDVLNSHSKIFNVTENKFTDIYFTNTANQLYKNECWGLISAPLGRQEKINDFKNIIWFHETDSIKQWYTQKSPDWLQTKENFLKKYTTVLEYRQKIEQAVDSFKKIENIELDLNVINKEKNYIAEDIEALQIEIKQKEEEREMLNSKIKTLHDNLREIDKYIPIWKKILSPLFKKDRLFNQYNQIKAALETSITQKSDLSITINNMKIELERLNNKVREYDNQIIIKEKEKEQILKQIEEAGKIFGKNFITDDLWSDISTNKELHISCPWTNTEYDKLREELFYEALALHKAFILNSHKIKNNISLLVKVWDKKIKEQDKKRAYADLLTTLFLVVPVISTTFASVSRLFEYIDKEQLGTLIIDEAGQATPQSALGALWRTQKAIIVGDPLQIEPVVTVPQEIAKRFAEKFNIDYFYRNLNISAQVLADNINNFGGYRVLSEGENEKMLWVGCPLLVHRRCIDPMFSIANKIAYNDKMFNETAPPQPDIPLVLEKSLWIDIKGNTLGPKNHFVPEQGEMVIKLIREFLQKNPTSLPDLYIISPFKSVVEEMKSLILKNFKSELKKENNKKWLENNCGTIHTFQGKEANEVILLLGCDTTTGSGAAQWAGKTPNILNVALTRAKYRIAIIGDAELWSKIPYFDTAYDILTSKFEN